MKTSTFIKAVKDYYYAETGETFEDRNWRLRRIEEGVVTIGVKDDRTNLANFTGIMNAIMEASQHIQYTACGESKTGVNIELMKMDKRYQKGSWALQDYLILGLKGVEYK